MDSTLWSFVKSMRSKIDGAYVCVNLQSETARAFMEDASRQSDRQQFPQLLKTIQVYNNKLGTLCNASKLNVMPTSKSETGFHNDSKVLKQGVLDKVRLIHLMNTGKRLDFKMHNEKSEHSTVCSTNEQHHIISGKSCTYCDEKIAQHKGSNTDSGIVLSVVANPEPGGKLR